MEAHQQALTNGHAPVAAERVNELIELRAAYRRQAQVIDTLTGAITRLRTRGERAQSRQHRLTRRT
jgi:hypothetical protein